jgi:hypothetical protein
MQSSPIYPTYKHIAPKREKKAEKVFVNQKPKVDADEQKEIEAMMQQRMECIEYIAQEKYKDLLYTHKPNIKLK